MLLRTTALEKVVEKMKDDAKVIDAKDAKEKEENVAKEGTEA